MRSDKNSQLKLFLDHAVWTYIFALLGPADLLLVSQVCKVWYQRVVSYTRILRKLKVAGLLSDNAVFSVMREQNYYLALYQLRMCKQRFTSVRTDLELNKKLDAVNRKYPFFNCFLLISHGVNDESWFIAYRKGEIIKKYLESIPELQNVYLSVRSLTKLELWGEDTDLNIKKIMQLREAVSHYFMLHIAPELSGCALQSVTERAIKQVAPKMMIKQARYFILIYNALFPMSLINDPIFTVLCSFIQKTTLKKLYQVVSSLLKQRFLTSDKLLALLKKPNFILYRDILFRFATADDVELLNLIYSLLCPEKQISWSWLTDSRKKLILNSSKHFAKVMIPRWMNNENHFDHLDECIQRALAKESKQIEVFLDAVCLLSEEQLNSLQNISSLFEMLGEKVEIVKVTRIFINHCRLMITGIPECCVDGTYINYLRHFISHQNKFLPHLKFTWRANQLLDVKLFEKIPIPAELLKIQNITLAYGFYLLRNLVECQLVDQLIKWLPQLALEEQVAVNSAIEEIRKSFFLHLKADESTLNITNYMADIKKILDKKIIYAPAFNQRPLIIEIGLILANLISFVWVLRALNQVRGGEIKSLFKMPATAQVRKARSIQRQLSEIELLCAKGVFRDNAFVPNYEWTNVSPQLSTA